MEAFVVSCPVVRQALHVFADATVKPFHHTIGLWMKGAGQSVLDFILFAQGVEGMTINVANGKSTSLLRLLVLLNEFLGTDIQPKFAEPRVGDVRDSLADISQARG